MVPEARPTSYYGRPILKAPVWKQPDVPLYLFAGGVAGVSALVAEAAVLTSRPGLARSARLLAATAVTGGTVALVHDLGRPERFLNMLRVFKPTSPLSVGSWILAPFGGLAAVSAAADLAGRLPTVGRLAGAGAAVLGGPLATYTAALLSNTAVPAWHEAYREMPFLFAASAGAAAGGLLTATAPRDEAGPARRLAGACALADLAAVEAVRHRLGPLGRPYREGRPKRLLELARGLQVGGLLTLPLARRSRLAGVVSGLAFAGASVATRFAVFQAGLASARDPAATVQPQRARVDARAATP
jgi:DMSO reductase anchor subunit